ncbi:MAG TPA: C25 family cysteine peptidase [Bacteroidales bacterium]|nr:C25 family cysteine peptidase [Bacteroidales bacterium]
MKRATFLFVALFLASVSFAQTSISLQPDETELRVKNSTAENLQVENKIMQVDFHQESTEVGQFSGLDLKGYHKNHAGTPGNPDLPVLNRLLEVPHGASISVTVVDYDEVVYDLDDLNLDKIAPRQPSYAKNADEASVVYHYNSDVYTSDEWIEPEIATATLGGVMRGIQLGQVSICPFRYNPATNELAVLNNIKLDISFEGGDAAMSSLMKEKYYSPEFTPAYSQLLNYQEPAGKDSFTSYPIKYVIVADRQFETTLQPFIQWKTKSGYNVVEAYTDVIGSTTTDIQNYLQGLYDAGSASDPAPTYVLIVGDHDGNYNVPAHAGETGGHVTDVYYGCYDGTNDNIPDVYLGRMSANTTTELQNVLDKILPYEQYTIPDGSYLNECMLIAGVDGTFAQTHGDGTISYGIREYFNTAHGFSDIYAYYHTYTSGDYHVMSSTSGSASSDIISKISNGVGFANYTAHCFEQGWGDPAFQNGDIAGLANNNEYPFMIGNCCLSFKFDYSDAFGEQILYAQNKGAINYIGTSNNSYWDEDVYWGIGLTSLGITEANVPNHDYSNTGQGGYDGVWHEHGESFDEWFFTGGQMVYCANMQVESSSSSRKQYYWEIYHNSGDPSLMPYMTEPDALTISYSDPMVGATSLTVTTEPYTYVAISQNGVLLDAKWSGSGSSVNLSFASLTSDPASVVATKQDKIPHINDFTPIAPNPPVADFSGTPTTLLEGESVTFTDNSQYAASYSWDFGDGNTSTEANPVHTYMSAGTYTVSLEVTNALGNDTETKVDYITVNPNTNPPVADFTADVTTVTTGGTVNFSDLSTNLPDGWSWTFNGGTPATSTNQNPSVTYDAAGTYTVELTASNSYGSDTETKVDYITVELPSYCAAGSNNTSYEYLSNVLLGTIDNASGQTSYSDFSAMSTDAAPGDDLAFTATISGAYASDHVMVWADWNRDGDFADTGESVFTSADGEGPHSTTITVPGGTTAGPVRVRVRLEDTDYGPISDPCGNSDYGEVEDYTINVVSTQPAPVASFTASPLTSCDGIVQFTDASSDAESWSWDFGDGNTSTEQNPQHTYAGNGNYTVSLTVSNTAGSDTYTETDYITVDIPDATIDAVADLCETSGAVTLTAATAGGTWSGTGISGDSFDPATAGPGDHTIQYEVTIGTCTDTDTEIIHVDAMPDATIDAVADQCETNSEVTLTAATAGGTWSGTGVTGNTFDPAVAGAGDFTITYEVTNSTCTATDNTNIHVDATPNATIDPVGALCVSDAAVTLTAATSGGTWSGTGVSGNQFDPATAGIGTHTVTYEVSNGACTATDNISIDVTDVADATIDAVADMCETDGSITLTAATAGGTWSGTGIVDATAGTFDPATAGPGDHTITYEITGSCGDSDTETIHVDGSVDATITDPGAFCLGDAATTLTAVTSGGTWSGTGMTGSTFDPATAGVGTHTITYSVTNGTCSDTDQIDLYVSSGYDATIDAVSDLCESNGAITLTATDAGGTWSGTGIVDASAGTFDPATAGPGDHTITYEITGSCGDIDTEIIHVDADVDATITPVGTLCASDAPVTLTAATSGGTWSGTGVSGNMFDPAIAGLGTHTITYEVSNGACTATDNVTIDVIDNADATIDAIADMCESSGSVTLTAATAGGTWSGTGIIDASAGTFDPSTAGPGDHTITYEITGSCGDTDTEIVHVDAAVDATINPVGTLCASDAPVTLTAATSGGTWSGTGVSGNMFDPAVSGTGTFTITYEISNGTCFDSDDISITVTDAADATIDPVADLCETSGSVTLTAATSGGTWSGNGVSGNTFNPQAAGPGDHMVTYEITGSCGDTDQITIHVDAMPDATITDPGSFCLGDAAVTLNAAETGGTWSGNGVSGSEFDPNTAGIGNHTISYEIVNGTCAASDDVSIAVGDIPSVDITVYNATTATSEDGSASAAVSGGLAPYDYLWSNGDTDNVMEDVSAGTYSLMVTDAAGCMYTTPVEIDFANSIDEESASLAVYPNPAGSEVFVEMHNMSAESISMVNVIGQTVHNLTVQSDIERIDVSDLKSGVYFIKIKTADQEHIQKLIIE